MSPFAIQLTDGCLVSDIENSDIKMFDTLKDAKIVEERDGLWRLNTLYRAGRLYVGKDGRGYVESEQKEQKDILVEADDFANATHGDIVVVKRVIARRGRASGKVQFVLSLAHHFTLAYIHKGEDATPQVLDIRSGEPTFAKMKDIDLTLFKVGTVFKVDTKSDEVLEVLGHLGDARVDEKISLALFGREDEFPKFCLSDALNVEKEVCKDEHPDRVDLTHLNFCTIDPVTAKDFDDAIYFDTKEHTLYVAIADVSHYVPYFTNIDKEAKQRGFTTYLPHKSFPMLPRELSENICSLKPKVDRLAFVVKIELERETLKPIKETFFEAIIHSKHRFNYEYVDKIFDGNAGEQCEVVDDILAWLTPLRAITSTLRESRMKSGFDFRSEESRIVIDAEHILVSTQVEVGTPSHSLIEECMLLANQASAKRFDGDGDGIFRIHEPPQLSRLEKLLSELAIVGLYVDEYTDSKSLIRAIQTEAAKLGLVAEVDAMVIKSLRQASYSSDNAGHFGLGFSHYSHFTSPIRRYSDLILHRLIKTQLQDDQEEAKYLLRNMRSLCVRVSELEREATKAEWDFRDRKYARWAKANSGLFFEAEVAEVGESAKAVLKDGIEGVVVHLKGDGLMLFERIRVMITDVNIAQAVVLGTLVNRIEKDEMEI